MIRWCSFCQTFQGEVAPFDTFDVTHGICKDCRSNAKASMKIDDRLRELVAFFRSLGEAASQGRFSTIGETLDRAAALGIAPFDLLMGMLQPLLRQIGNNYVDGKVTVADEHRFTAYAEALIVTLSIRLGIDPCRAGPADVMFFCVNGNYHAIGLRALQLAFASTGIRCVAYFPSLPSRELVGMASTEGVAVVGLAVSEAAQVLEAQKIKRQVVEAATAAGRQAPRFVIGGSGVRAADPAVVAEIADLTVDPADFRRFLADVRAAVAERRG